MRHTRCAGFIFGSLCALASFTGCATTSVGYRSFVHITGEINEFTVEACAVDDSSACATETKDAEVSVAASGFVVDGAPDGSMYIVTAGHFCLAPQEFDKSFAKKLAEKGMKISAIERKFDIVVKSDTGDSFDARVLAIDSTHDICVLSVSGDVSSLKPVQYADEMPDRGKLVTNIAAPLGSWAPNAAHLFDGRYTGKMKCGETLGGETLCSHSGTTWDTLSLPATYGSSGSPVFDERGRLICVVVAVLGGFENVAVAANVEDVKNIIAVARKHDAALAASDQR